MLVVCGGLAGCGARSTLEDGEGGAGAGTATVSPSASRASSTQAAGNTGSTTSGQPIACSTLQLVDPVVVADTQGPAQTPQIAALPGGEALLTWLRGAELEMSAIPAFTTWPTGLATVTPMAGGVTSFTLGAGRGGPTANVSFRDGTLSFAESVWPSFVAYEVPGAEPATSLFVTAIEQAWLFGLGSDFGGISINSFGLSSFVQSEYGFVCSSRPLATAVPAVGGLLGVYGELYSFDFCDTGKAWPDALVMVRFDLAPSFDDPLVPVNRNSIQTVEPMVSLAMAPASFGAWVVYQTDGSTSRVAPPVQAFRLGQDARPLSLDIAVSPSGFGVGPIATTSIGDALFVAYASDDRAGETIVVQRVDANETLGPSVVVSTGVAPRTGKLQLVASEGGDKLLLGWEAQNGNLGLARLDCADLP